MNRLVHHGLAALIALAGRHDANKVSCCNLRLQFCVSESMKSDRIVNAVTSGVLLFGLLFLSALNRTSASSGERMWRVAILR